MSRMVEVVIDSVRVSLTNQQRIVVLREKDTERYLPIWIGPYEAESITIALQEIEVVRPHTHDLMKNLLFTLNARLVRIEITTLRDDVYFGNLVLDFEGRTVNVDTRPSDALGLAVRCHVPVLVSLEVMEAAGVVPEEDIQEQPASVQEETSPEMESGEGEDRLSVFEDFLSNLEFDEPSGEDNAEDKPDDEDTDPDPQ